jgi:hypothetical protein
MKWLSTGSKEENYAIEQLAIESLSFDISLAEKEMIENQIKDTIKEIELLCRTGDIDLADKKAGDYLNIVEKYNKIIRYLSITQHPSYSKFKLEYTESKDYNLE